MTGAPMPDGADAVVMVELTSVEGDDVVLAADAPVGQHVRPVGDDIRPGDEVLDIACGTGLVTLPAAAAVGPGGRVLATDLAPRMVAALDERAAAAGLDNVESAEVAGDPRHGRSRR